MFKKFNQGGVNMMNVETQIMSFRLRWLGRISDESDNMWKKMANFWFDQIGGLPLLLNCDYDEKKSFIVVNQKYQHSIVKSY